MLDENGNEIVDPAQEMLNEGAPPVTQTVDYQKLFEQQQLQMQQMAQQNAQLAQTVQQVATRPVIQQQVNQPDPFAAFNPETASALKAALEQQNKQFQQQFQQQEQRFAGMQIDAEANSIAAMGLDPAITKRAQETLKTERARGVPLNVQNAVDFAIGEAVRNGTFKGNVPVNQQRVGSAPATITGGSRQPGPTKARPTNFDAMSRKAQIAHFESDETIHNAPIQGFWEND